MHPRLLPIADYYRVIVAFSGGKDSIACVLSLLDAGVPREKIELWHQDVDGREGSSLMDWPVTRSYCRAFAAAFGLRILFQWKVGGFEREMLRHKAPTAPTRFELLQPDGSVTVGQAGGKGAFGTRRQFPQVCADLSKRWCSAYLKIDVASIALRNDPRFRGVRTLFVSGERAEESPSRAQYAVVEPHRATLAKLFIPVPGPVLAPVAPRVGLSLQCLQSVPALCSEVNAPMPGERFIDHFRPVHGLKEAEVWELLKKYRVNPHPAYRIGFGRVSCMKCIFGNADQWATVGELDGEGITRVAAYEAQFGKTISRSKLGVDALAGRGKSYLTQEMREKGTDRLAMREEFAEEIIVPEGSWVLPAGAFRHCGGPT